LFCVKTQQIDVKIKIHKRVRGARWLSLTSMPNFNSSSRQRSYCVYRRRMQKQKINKHTTAQGFSSLGVFVFILMIFVSVLYLFSTNEVAIKGDEIYTIENDIKELARENESLVIKEAELRSLESIENIVKDKNMQEITEPVYIDRETRVALDE